MRQPRHLPSIEALTGNDDERLIAELRLSDVCERAAVLRELLEEVERLVRSAGTATSSEGHSRGAVVVEELARLGCKMVELAGALARERSPASAIEMRPWAPSVTH
jgi:hypothetical protein